MKAHRSVFDEYSRSQDPLSHFDWVKVDARNILGNTEIVCEGELNEYDYTAQTLMQTYYYVATYDNLYQFSSKANPIPCKVLKLVYPRMEEAETEQSGSYGFTLTALGKTYYFFAENKAERDRWYDTLRFSSRILLTNLAHDYDIGEIVGSGNYSKVHSATKKGTSNLFAIKSVSKSKLFADTRNIVKKRVLPEQKALVSEIETLRVLRHPRVISLFEVYEGSGHVHLVLEYLKGGELFDKIQSKGSYSEADAARVIKRLLEAVGYLHQKHVLHRDLKPENIIMTQYISTIIARDSTSDLNFKIVDFGLAIFAPPGTKITQRCGSPGYAAPEVLLKKEYDLKADVFSCGVILYALYPYPIHYRRLTGVSPFAASSISDILKSNEKCEIRFPEENWKGISEEAKDLVSLMTQRDPEKRISINAALTHPWFIRGPSSSVQLHSALENMKKYSYEYLQKLS